MSQIDNPELRSRASARKLKDKENLTLAEKLILASNEDKFSFTYKGVPVEVWSPTRGDFTKFIDLYNSVAKSEEEERTEDEQKAVENELYNVVAELCIDESITPELLSSDLLGINFIQKLMNEILEYQKREVEEVTAVKGFRKK